MKEFLKSLIDESSFELEPSPAIFDSLLFHSLEGIFYYFMKNKIDEDLRNKLEKRLSFLIARDTIQRKILKEVALKVKKKKLRFLILKGPSIADELYPPLTRFCEDIDILVHRDDYNSLRECILKIGFVPYSGKDGFVFTPAFKEEILVHQKMDYIQIDLHRALFSEYRFRMDFEDLWNSSKPFNMDGIELKKMEPFREFIYLILHSAAHFYKMKGINILDMALHYKKYNHNLKQVLEEMKRKNNHYGGYYVLKFLMKNGFIPVDESELEAVRPDFFSKSLMNFLISTEKITYLRFEKLPFFVRAGTVLASIPGFFDKAMFTFYYLRRRTDAVFKKFKSRWNKV